MSTGRMNAGVRSGAGLLLILGISIGPSLAGGEAPAVPSLLQLLQGLDRASYLYLDAALRFACKEKIDERRHGERMARNFEYLFVYDKVHGFQDYRMVVRKGQRLQVSPTELGVSLFLERAYMWVLIFNRTRQDKYRYGVSGTGTIHGIQAIKIRFEPIPPYKESINDWVGTAWIDPSSYQILRVEAVKAADFEEEARMKEAAASMASVPGEGPGRSYRIERVSTDFTVTKNGMRFPGEAKIVSTLYYLPRHPEWPNPEVIYEQHTTQTYSKYRFYGVRTSEEVKEILTPRKKRAK